MELAGEASSAEEQLREVVQEVGVVRTLKRLVRSKQVKKVAQCFSACLRYLVIYSPSQVTRLHERLSHVELELKGASRRKTGAESWQRRSPHHKSSAIWCCFRECRQDAEKDIGNLELGIIAHKET